MSKELVCSECGKELGGVSVFEFEGNTYCEECFCDLTVICQCCGDRIWRDSVEGDSLTVLCDRCYDNYYCHCQRCGRLISNEDLYYMNDDDDYGYCYDCYQSMISNPIKNYSYKPEPIFYGNGKLFYGIELEIDKGGESPENAQIFLDYMNRDAEHLYIKRDSSISNGMEWVFHPSTLEYALNSVDFSGLFEKAVSIGYRSHQTQTCGLHIHVNRTAFGNTYDEQEEVIARIVFFVENHWNELLMISRRSEENINRWASRYGISENTQDTYQKAKSKHLGRYTAVNLETYGQQTLEFRLFRGTLRYQTFVATLQLVDEICNTCINMDDEELEGLSWSSFVLGIKEDKPELIEYLKSKRLYVNEIVIESEEM